LQGGKEELLIKTKNYQKALIEFSFSKPTTYPKTPTIVA
jgi:hypothetical protein